MEQTPVFVLPNIREVRGKQLPKPHHAGPTPDFRRDASSCRAQDSVLAPHYVSRVRTLPLSTRQADNGLE